MNEILVSVIIPTFNRSRSISRAVNSVINQTLDNIEVIVVDDNGLTSEEGIATSKVMESYKNNNKVIYVRHDTNKNGSAARNSGIKKSSGRYITFLDDDDEYVLDRLEKMYYVMENQDSSWGACYSGYIKYMPDNNLQISSEVNEGDLYKQALMRSLYIGSGSNLFFRKSVIDDIGYFDVSFKRNQDLEYLIRVLKKYKIKHINENLLNIYYDINRPVISFEESKKREINFRNKFKENLEILNDKEKKEVTTMWELDWLRTLLVRKKIISALTYSFNAKIPIKVYYEYIKYAVDRKKNNKSYGFIVRL